MPGGGNAGDEVSPAAHEAKKRDKDAQRIKSQKHVDSELPKMYTVLSGAISGHVTGGNSGGQEVELVPGDSFWMPAQFTVRRSLSLISFAASTFNIQHSSVSRLPRVITRLIARQSN